VAGASRLYLDPTASARGFLLSHTFPFAKTPGAPTLFRVTAPVTRSRDSLFWLLQIGGWLIAIPVFVLVLLVVFTDPVTALAIGVTRQAIGFGITFVLWRIYRAWPPREFQLAQQAWKIVLCCVFATLADFLLAEVIRGVMTLPVLPEYALRGSFFVRLAVYVAWSALYFGIRQQLEGHAQELELARAEAAAREAELQLLRAQVNPHFVFNALSSIVGHAEDNPPAVVETAYAVSDYLRYSLTQRAHRAALGDELGAMTNYLRVERMSRGEKNFEWVIDATLAARGRWPPPRSCNPWWRTPPSTACARPRCRCGSASTPRSRARSSWSRWRTPAAGSTRRRRRPRCPPPESAWPTCAAASCCSAARRPVSTC
jgi:hypothetical protein